MYKPRTKLLAGLFAAIVTASSIYAQSTTSLRGLVSDSTGAVIPGAVVTITNSKIGFTRQTTADPTGQYQFPQIGPGVYDVKVEQQGFRVTLKSMVELLVNTPGTLNFKLELGNVTETINVVSEASALNTVDASVGNAFTQAQVRQLPLLTRNVVELLSLQPGVTSTGEVLGANPNLVPKVPFIENMFPGLANLYITGSDSANYFDAIFNQNDGSQLDALNQMDRERSSKFPNCIAKTGCNTFFPNQNAGSRTWTNAGNSNFHAMTMTFRRPLQNGVSFDFNYTWSHSLLALRYASANSGCFMQRHNVTSEMPTDTAAFCSVGCSSSATL